MKYFIRIEPQKSTKEMLFNLENQFFMCVMKIIIQSFCALLCPFVVLYFILAK